jgi:hypothetical protein
MRVLVVLVLAASLILLVSGETQALSGWTGNDLRKWIDEYEKGDREPARTNWLYNGWFVGYVSGISDVGTGGFFCIREGATRKQVCDVVAKYVNQNPEIRDNPARDLVVEALKQAFPCIHATK